MTKPKAKQALDIQVRKLRVTGEAVHVLDPERQQRSETAAARRIGAVLLGKGGQRGVERIDDQGSCTTRG